MLVTQSFLTLQPDHSPPGSSVHGDSSDKNTRVGCHYLLQGIIPIQGLNTGFPHCRQILYHLSHQGSPSTSKHSANVAVSTCAVFIILIVISLEYEDTVWFQQIKEKEVK